MLKTVGLFSPDKVKLLRNLAVYVYRTMLTKSVINW